MACALFILHQGLHLPIYLGAANITYVSSGEDITRATVFAPMLNLLALGFVLAKRRWTPGWMVVLAITLAAILVSLTRTLVIAAVAGLVIAIIARELSRPDFGRVARRVGTIVLAAVVVVVGFSRFVPAYWGFLLKRFSEFTSSASGGTQVSNWHLRVIHWDAIERVVAQERHPVRPRLPATRVRPRSTPHYVHWTSDMTWLPIMYLFGYAGLVLVRAPAGGVHGTCPVALAEAARRAT